MPNFPKFNHFGLFSKIADNEDTQHNFGFFSQRVSQTTLDSAKFSVPIYWLINKINVSITGTATLLGGTPKTFSRTQSLTIENNIPPNERICLEDNRLIILGETDDEFPMYTELTIGPFQCEKVHFYNRYFLEYFDNISIGMDWYITSSTNTDGMYDGFTGYDPSSGADQAEIVNTQTFNITLPNEEIITLYGYTLFSNAGYSEYTASGSITSFEIEWWEPEQDI